MHVDIPYTSIMTSFIFFEKLESAFGPAVPNTPSPSHATQFDSSVKDPMDENVTAGNIIADWPLRYFTTAWVIGSAAKHAGYTDAIVRSNTRHGYSMRSVCHNVDNLHEERCAPEMKYASLQAKCVVQGHTYIIWNDVA